MPAPDSGIDVQNLELAIPRILFEFHFHKTGEASCRQQALRGFGELRLADGLDEGAELAEILGLLAQALGHYGGERNSVFAKRRVRKLGLSSPWNHFLDDHVFQSNETTCFLEVSKHGIDDFDTP